MVWSLLGAVFLLVGEQELAQEEKFLESVAREVAAGDEGNDG